MGIVLGEGEYIGPVIHLKSVKREGMFYINILKYFF
jgi:hypothetical protein